MRAFAAPLALCVCAAACGPPRGSGRLDDGEVSARIVAAERGRGGVRLVLVDENGARVADVTAPALGDEPGAFTVDTQPAWSPDGRWVAFASNRGRAEGSSLWLVEARADAEPRRLELGDGDAVDRDPSWSPDGRALVFSSNRSGSFDLWRVALDPGADGWPAVAAEPEQLTDAATDEVSPAWSPDGELIAYAVFDRQARRSGIWLLPANGSDPRPLTRGELEQTPAWSPDSRWIAFSAPSTRADGSDDMDIYVIRRDGTTRRAAIDDDIAHETTPAWSADGRYLFATAVLRNEQTGAPFFWSIVFVDGDDARAGVRALRDPVAVPRVAFALAPKPLRDEALAALPRYDRASVLAVLRELCRDFPEDRLPPVCQCLVGPVEDRPDACK